MRVPMRGTGADQLVLAVKSRNGDGAKALDRPALPAGQPQGVGPEAYLHSTSQGEPVLSLSNEHPRTPGRTVISAVAVDDS